MAEYIGACIRINKPFAPFFFLQIHFSLSLPSQRDSLRIGENIRKIIEPEPSMFAIGVFEFVQIESNTRITD